MNRKVKTNRVSMRTICDVVCYKRSKCLDTYRPTIVLLLV